VYAKRPSETKQKESVATSLVPKRSAADPHKRVRTKESDSTSGGEEVSTALRSENYDGKGDLALSLPSAKTRVPLRAPSLSVTPS